MKTQDTFARRLHLLRESAGLSIYALAQRSGVSRQFLGELERGAKEPSLDTARKIARALGHGLECWNN
jgi:transcriptional regulator with XRE-family HTH domain